MIAGKRNLRSKNGSKTIPWQSWCHVCSKNEGEQVEDQCALIEVAKLKKTKMIEIKDAMLQFFRINLTQLEIELMHICRGCYSLLISLKEFDKTVNKAQIMFQYLQGASICWNFIDIRKQFGLHKDERSFKKLLDVLEYDVSFESEETNGFEAENLSITNQESEDASIVDTIETENNESDTESECSTISDENQFDNARNLRARKRFEHIDKLQKADKIKAAKVYECHICLKKFKSDLSKNFHIRTQHKSYDCDQCGAAKRTSSALKSHMLVHSDECEICKKRFKRNNTLKDHKEIHDAKKYVCGICGKELKSLKTYIGHSKVHSNKMPHKCEYCGKAFKHSKSFRRHLILHTGLRPYECEFCGKTFNQGPNCRTHKKRMHPDELAEQEAAGIRPFAKNIPSLSALKEL